MLETPPDDRVRELWRKLANAPKGLGEPGVTVVSDDAARVTRPGWCAVVAIGDAAIVTTPRIRPDGIDELLMAGLSPEMLTDPDRVSEITGPLESMLGPADLQYGSVRGERAPTVSGPLRVADPLVRKALASIPPEDRSEAGFDDASAEAVFVAAAADGPVAVAGYRCWEGVAAHMGVATTPHARRLGHGRAVAHAAAAYATERGLLVQWRSFWSNDASRQLGRSLGLVRCGRQLSFRVRSSTTPATR